MNEKKPSERLLAIRSELDSTDYPVSRESMVILDEMHARIQRLEKLSPAPPVSEWTPVVAKSRSDVRVGMLINRTATDKIDKSILGDGVAFEWIDQVGGIVRIISVDNPTPPPVAESAEAWAERMVVSNEQTHEITFVGNDDPVHTRQSWNVLRDGRYHDCINLARRIAASHLTAYAAQATREKDDRIKELQAHYDECAGAEATIDDWRNRSTTAESSLSAARAENEAMRKVIEAWQKYDNNRGMRAVIVSGCVDQLKDAEAALSKVQEAGR